MKPWGSAHAHPPAGEAWWVVCLCAAWCNTCTDYRATFDAVAKDWPQMRFEWLDIEDEAEMAGELEVETFPTLLVADGDCICFLGPLLPHAGVLTRLIGSLRSAGLQPHGLSHAPGLAHAQGVLQRLRSARA